MSRTGSSSCGWYANIRPDLYSDGDTYCPEQVRRPLDGTQTFVQTFIQTGTHIVQNRFVVLWMVRKHSSRPLFRRGHILSRTGSSTCGWYANIRPVLYSDGGTYCPEQVRRLVDGTQAFVQTFIQTVTHIVQSRFVVLWMVRKHSSRSLFRRGHILSRAGSSSCGWYANIRPDLYSDGDTYCPEQVRRPVDGTQTFVQTFIQTGTHIVQSRFVVLWMVRNIRPALYSDGDTYCPEQVRRPVDGTQTFVQTFIQTGKHIV